MEVLELLVEDMSLIGDAISENVWEDDSLFALELVRFFKFWLAILVSFYKLMTFPAVIHIPNLLLNCAFESSK